MSLLPRPIGQRWLLPLLSSALLLGAAASQAASLDHSAHGQQPQASASSLTAASQAYAEANQRMHSEMAIDFSGNPDIDFVKAMIPHHQGALEMAKIVLAYGQDAQIRALAEEVIAAQQREIQHMQQWLERQKP